MMNALLGSVSYAAMSSALPLFIDTSYVLDETKKASGYTITNDGKTLTNTSGGTDYRRWVPTVGMIPQEDKIFYWEIQCLATGPASYNGYLGVASSEQILSSEGPTTSNNPISYGSIGYRGNGTLWAGNTTEQVTGMATYGVNSRIMIAFNPMTKKIWFGKDGIWHRNPESQDPSYTSILGSNEWYPYVQGRDTNSGGTIHTVPDEFLYPIPSNAQALGRVNYLYEMQVPISRVYQVLGKLETGITLHNAQVFAIVGKSDTALTVHSSRLYLVVEP